jgi:hypothetical protein
MIRRFNRFELKYVIPVATRDALESSLQEHMTTDEFGGSDGSYRVTSLYYDTRNLDCYWAKIEGTKYRRKLRVRIYGAEEGDDTSRGMVEIKQRINRTVQKRRVALSDAYRLCGGEPPRAFDDPEDAAVASEVVFLVRTLGLAPSCVISYLRKAYVGGQYESGLRITFDQLLSCRGPQMLLAPGAPTYMFMSPDVLVMEVKVNDRIPLWVARMLARHHCSLQRVSKYCRGLFCLRSREPAGILEGVSDG